MRAERAILLAAGMAALTAGAEPSVDAQKAVVSVVHLAADGTEILRGHGFLISGEGLLVTNYHLVVRAKRLRATLASGDIYDQVSLKALDPAADLAILKIPAFNAPYVPLSKRAPAAGDVLEVVAGGQSAKRVRTLAVSGGAPGAGLYTADSGWDAANKGCPAIDAEGGAVGITTLAYRGAPGTGVIASTGKVQELLKQAINWPLEDMDWRSWPVGENPAVAATLAKAGLSQARLNPEIWSEKNLARRLEMGLAFDASDVQARALLAQTLIQQRGYVQAQAEVQELLARDAGSAVAMGLQADLWQATGRFDEARAMYERAVKGGGEAPRGYNRELHGVAVPEVTHEHTILNCSGSIILAAERIAYRRSAGLGNDNFTVPYSSIGKVGLLSSVSAGQTVYELHFDFALKTGMGEHVKLTLRDRERRDQIAAYLRGKGVTVVEGRK